MKILRQLKFLSAKASLDQGAILLSIIEGFRISIPQGTVDAINTVSMPAKSMGNALDCILVDQAGGIDLIYLRLIWSLAIQLLCIVINTLIILILKWKSYQTMAIYMFIFLQPAFLIEFTNLLAKREISGNSYVQANVSYLYDTDSHSKWLNSFAYPGFFIFLILIPVLFFYQLLQGKWYEKFNQIQYMQSWGYFYHQIVFLDYIMNIQMIEIGLFFIGNSLEYILDHLLVFQFVYRHKMSYSHIKYSIFTIIMGSFSSILTFIYLLLNSFMYLSFQTSVINKQVSKYKKDIKIYFIVIQPYSNKKLNKIDQVSNVILTLTFSIATIIYSTIQNNQNENNQLAIAGYIILGILNIPFILYLLLEIIAGKFDTLPNMIDKLRDKINRKYPALITMRNCWTCWNCCGYVNIPKFVLQNRTKARKRARDLWKDLMTSVNESLEEWKFDKSRPFRLHKWYNQILVPLDEGMDEYIVQ